MYMEKRYYETTPKKLPKYLPKEEIQRVINNANNDKSKHGRRNHLILTILWQTGIRASELAHLRKNDIQNDTILIRQGKGGKDRIIPIKPESRNLLLVYSDQMKADQTLFPITSRQLWNIINKYKLEGYDIHPHTFRHSFAVNCLQSGMNIRSLQKMLGHSSLGITQVYLDIVGDDIKKDYEKVDF
jgi:site-specific recombinase XerD